MKRTLSIAALVLALGACKEKERPAPPEPKSDPSASHGARTLPIPDSTLPPGHPPIDASSPVSAAPATGDLAWDVPQHWVVEKPSNNVRFAQYRVPGAGGDGECVVFYFGPGQGGDPMANARRWAGQFMQPDGRDSVEVMKVEPLPGTRVAVEIVEVGGTYDGGMSGTGQKPGYRLLGGIAAGADAPWFFKLVGPEATVRAERAAFVRMLESIRANG